MKNTKLILYSVFLLVFSACLLYNCQSEPVVEHHSHYVDTTSERSVQNEKCGSCHKDVYDNWKIGPHANAYLTLENHDKLVDSSKNFPDGYNTFIEDRMESVCMACHTGKNIFETNFGGINHNCNPTKILRDSFPKAFEQAFSRNIKNKKELITGVDCITCHVQKDKVVTNANSKASDTVGLIKSHLFSDNMNCYSCHHHQVSTMKELVDKKVMSSEINCVSCHQEYKDQGKGTHYFYWRNDHASKKRPKHLDIFECITLSIEHNKMLKFNWTNTVMPHGFSECGDAKSVVMAVYKNKKEKVILEQTINRKDFFDLRKEMPAHFHTGKNGNNFEYKVPIIQTVDLKDYLNIDHFIILGFVKPQYWSTDKEFIQVFKKEILFKKDIN